MLKTLEVVLEGVIVISPVNLEVLEVWEEPKELFEVRRVVIPYQKLTTGLNLKYGRMKIVV